MILFWILVTLPFYFGRIDSFEVFLWPQSLTLNQNDEGLLTLRVKNKPLIKWCVTFKYKDSQGKSISDNSTKIPIKLLKDLIIDNSTTDLSHNLTIIALKPGQITLILNITDDNKDFVPLSSLTQSRINVMFSKSLDIFSAVIGWIYFLAWTISFYPQIWINFKRKSVAGLNFDFLALNLLGFLCYSSFTLSLYFSDYIQKLYRLANHSLVIPVEKNDVFFCIHAVIITCVTISQCFFYKRREGQRISIFASVILIILILLVLIACILGGIGTITWLNALEFLSYEKILISLIKYVPQAYFNCRRKSTIGWSIENILLDFTGGTLSTLQMFLIARNYDDFDSIRGNLAKLLLGLFSIFFDCFFMLQHFVLFRGNEDLEIAVQENSELSVTHSDNSMDELQNNSEEPLL